MGSDSKIFVAGHKGLVGSAIVRHLEAEGFTNIVTVDRSQCDLTNENAVKMFFMMEQPEYVFLAAAKVGGIGGNSDYPADFIYENLMIQSNVINSAAIVGVEKLLFLGSSCIYPKFAKQPITEDQLLTGALEGSNDAYAIAKIAGIKMCQAYRKQHGLNAIAVMPTNLYGPNDNYDIQSSHVMASLIKKFHEAKINNSKEVICWGTGKPLREFLYVDDLAEACFYVLGKWFPGQENSPKDTNGNILNWLNVGSDFEISIKELAEKIATIVGFNGEILWDDSKPDGTPRKKLDNSHINKIGWFARTDLNQGIKKTLECINKGKI